MKVTVNNRFGILLAEKRIKERRPISLSEVAEKTGVSRRALYAWENNRVNRFDVPVIDALCKYFEVQPGDLFHYIDDSQAVKSKTPELDVAVMELPHSKKEIKEIIENLPKKSRHKKPPK